MVGITDMLRRTLGEHVSLSTSLARNLWETRADAAQVQSAIVNLAVNARDAMPKGGRLIIETRNVELDRQDGGEAGADAEVKAGEYILLALSDTGTGMPREVRDRAFEPFFTTKEPGRGTGLGLAMVYGFVKQTGGHVTIYSEVGHGTTINLYLPRVVSAGGELSAERPKSSADPQAREVILVVEDDERVRRLAITRLKGIGYKVLEAANGPEALAILSGDDHIDLLFTDLVMPGGLSGREVASKAKKMRPGIKVLLTSGYAEELVQGEDLQREHLKVLRKPYRQADLVMALRGILGELTVA